MDERKYISSVKLTDGSIYGFKDAKAREILDNLFSNELIIDCGGAPLENFLDETIIDCGGAPI